MSLGLGQEYGWPNQQIECEPQPDSGALSQHRAATAAATETANWQRYPNPAHGQVQLAGLPGPVAAQVFDGQGRLVRTATPPLNDLAPGLYHLRATSAGRARPLRLMVE